MGTIQKHPPVKLIIGILAQASAFARTRAALIDRYGPIDLDSGTFPFDHTQYYLSEMGPGLSKVFYSFERLIDIDTVAQVKIATNAMEEAASEGPRRRVNIDPGYLVPSKLVLLTTKNYQHRIHIAGGIYAEMTLRADKNGFHDCAWTFPDYRQQEYKDFFMRVRAIYMDQI